MGLLKPADKNSLAKHLETACKKVFPYTASPSYKSIKNILAAGWDKTDTESHVSFATLAQNKHIITRELTIIGGNGYDKLEHFDKLIDMRLNFISDAFIAQLNDPNMKDISFEDRSGLLVDIE